MMFLVAFRVSVSKLSQDSFYVSLSKIKKAYKDKYKYKWKCKSKAQIQMKSFPAPPLSPTSHWAASLGHGSIFFLRYATDTQPAALQSQK